MIKNKKLKWIEFIESHITECDVSDRGGNLKVDVSELFPNIDKEYATMEAIQNYLDVGMAGAIVGAAQFMPQELNKKDQKVFYELKEVIKQYFNDLKQGDGDKHMVKNVNSYNLSKRTNITPILEHVLGVSEIDNEKDLRMLIDALDSMPEDAEINTENMAKIMEKIKEQKASKSGGMIIPIGGTWKK